MAPSSGTYYDGTPTSPTLIGNEVSACGSHWVDNNTRRYYYVNNTPKSKQIVESKEEKTIRISREKMFASWRIHDEVKVSQIKIKQFCKPKHRLMAR